MKKLFLLVAVISFGMIVFAQKRVAQPKSKNELLNEEYCTGLFNTQHADYFDFLDDKVNSSALGYLNVLDWLQGRVSGLRVYNTRNNIRIPFIRNQRAGLFVNETWVDYDYLSVLPVTDIAMIKVIKGPFQNPMSGPGGAIAIYTIRGDEESEENPER